MEIVKVESGLFRTVISWDHYNRRLVAVLNRLKHNLQYGEKGELDQQGWNILRRGPLLLQCARPQKRAARRLVLLPVAPCLPFIGYRLVS
jgi:hypothetical protein